jgi:hypothetical protein
MTISDIRIALNRQQTTIVVADFPSLSRHLRSVVRWLVLVHWPRYRGFLAVSWMSGVEPCKF